MAILIDKCVKEMEGQNVELNVWSTGTAHESMPCFVIPIVIKNLQQNLKITRGLNLTLFSQSVAKICLKKEIQVGAFYGSEAYNFHSKFQLVA